MDWNSRRVFAGAASVCVVVLGFAVVWPMIRSGEADECWSIRRS